MSEIGLVLSLLAAFISVGGILIGVGVYKSKIARNDEVNAAQEKQIENCATKEELAVAANRGNELLANAIKRSDEMLDMMRKRVEEDRAAGSGRYKELYGILAGHAERISALETTQGIVTKTLDEIKSSLNGGFKEIRDELKDMRKARRET
ncbi:MAG: hypothetical protein LBO04_04745 [Spirochaetaceae bacterium]|jgi:hypothetical protein|nr:hypothetical protein [Spirochaetaceae bacterium]